MSKAVVPIGEMRHRMPEHGRIRTGIQVWSPKANKNVMKAIDTFRLTSGDEAVIRRAAELYGGEPRPWKDAPQAGEWEVITRTNTLPIALPPDPLGGTPIYELWSAGGCQRRCDGIVCTVPRVTDTDVDLVEMPCICTTEEAFKCKPKTRLNVVLPDLPFGGAWRFETGSQNAAREMPGMVEMLLSLQGAGAIVRGLMAIENETTVKAGRTKKFKVVRIRLDQSMEAIAAGLANVGALAQAPDRLALPSAPMLTGTGAEPDASEPYADDDDIVDAEILDDENLSTTTVIGGNQALQTKLIMAIKTLCDQHQTITGEVLDDDDVRHQLIEQQTNGRTTSSTQLTDSEKKTLIHRCELVGEGELLFGIKEGKAKIGRRS